MRTATLTLISALLLGSAVGCGDDDDFDLPPANFTGGSGSAGKGSPGKGGSGEADAGVEDAGSDRDASR